MQANNEFNSLPLGPNIPDNSIQDNSLLLQAPPTSQLHGLATSAEQSFLQNPTPNILSQIKGIGTVGFDPGSFMTPDQWQNSNEFRAGLHFPHGVYTNFAKLAASKFDSQQSRQNIIDRMPDTFASGVDKQLGSILGFAAGPVNIAATAAAPELIGNRVSSLLAGLDERSAVNRFVRTVTPGVGEGAFVMAPQSLTQFSADNQYGKNTSILDSLINIGAGAGLGGLVRGVFGFKSIISHDSFNRAREAAVKQLANGKMPDVSPIVKDGFNEARTQETSTLNGNVADIDRDNIIASKQKVISSLDDEINVQQKKVSDLEGSSEPTTINKEETDGFEMAKKLKSLLEKPEDKLTSSEKDFINRMKEQPDIVKTKALLGEKNLNLEDDRFMTLMKNGNEDLLARKRFNDLLFERAKANDSVNNISKETTETNLAHTQTSVDNLNFKTDMNTERMLQLDRSPSASKGLLKEKIKLFKLKDARNKLNEEVEQNKVSSQMTPIANGAVTAEDVMGSIRKMASPESDLAVNASTVADLENNLKDLPDTTEENMKSINDEFVKIEKDLPESLQDEIDKFKTFENDNKKFRSAIRKWLDCRKG